jgi:hypothetical protein
VVIDRIRPRARGAAVPLSFDQERFWFLEQAAPHGTYNCETVIRISGPVDPAALQASVREITRRHEILRTTFPLNGDTPEQRISDTVVTPLSTIDLGAVAVSAQDRALARVAQALADPTFDLARGPLLRFGLVRLAACDHALIVVLHHIVADAWSLAVFTRELVAVYRGMCAGERTRLPELPLQYADFAIWQRERLRGRDVDRLLAYWRRIGKGLDRCRLRTDRLRRPGTAPHPAAEGVFAVREVTAAVKRYARERRVTVFIILLSAWKLTLASWTGQTDIALSTDVAGREATELEGLIGVVINQLLLRTDLSGDPTYDEAVTRVKRTFVEAYRHRDVPFHWVVQTLASQRTGHATPTQVHVVLLPPLGEPLDVNGVRFTFMGSQLWRARFDLTLFLRDGAEHIEARLVYDAQLFERTTINGLLVSFLDALRAMVENPAESIRQFNTRRSAATPRLARTLERLERLKRITPVPIPLRQETRGRR